MLNQNSPEGQPEGSFHSNDLIPPRRPESSEPPALKQLCERILNRPQNPFRSLLEQERASGALSPERFTSLIRNTSDRPSLKEVGRSLELMMNTGVDQSFSVCMPALVHVASSLLAPRDAGQEDAEGKHLSHRLFNLVLSIMGKSEKFHGAFVSALDETANSELLLTASDGNQLDEGYWSCLELQTVASPTMHNLQRMFDAHEIVRDQIDDQSTPSQALMRAVHTLGEKDFEGVFELVMSEYRRCFSKPVKQQYDLDMLTHAMGGLALAAAPGHVETLREIVETADPLEFEVASRIIIILATQVEPEPDHTVLSLLKEDMLRVIEETESDFFGPRWSVALMAHRAFAALATSDEDLDILHTYTEQLIKQPSRQEHAQLLLDFAQAYEQILDAEEVEPLSPIPRIDHAERGVPRREGLCAQPHMAVPDLTGESLDNLLSDAAVELTELKTRNEVLRFAAQIAATVRHNVPTARPNEDGAPFVKALDFIRFAGRYRFIVNSGQFTAAASLLPEALQALSLSYADGGERTVKLQDAFFRLAASLTTFAFSINEHEDLRELSRARLSDSDWNLLRSLHDRGEEEEDSLGTHEPIALVALSLRAALESDLSWHDDFIKTIGLNQFSPSHFVAPVLIGEYKKPGSTWEMVARFSPRDHHGEDIRPLAAGISSGLAENYQKLFDLLCSHAADDITKGLLLSQVLRYDLNDEQGEECRHWSSHYLSEIGPLGVDAIATYGCFSSSAESAQEILSLPIPPGVDPITFTSVRLRAAARAIRNHFETQESLEREERGTFG